MFASTSIQFPGSVPPEPPSDRPWYASPSAWLALFALAFIALSLMPRVLTPRPQWAELYDPRMPCDVVDWRVGEKLKVLGERPDERSRMVHLRMTQQRDMARQQCRKGDIDTAMSLYGVIDRALTRQVQVTPAPPADQ